MFDDGSHFTADGDPQLERFELRVSSRDGRAYGLRSPGLILGYFHHFSGHDTSTNATVALEVPAAGTLNWIDPATGNVLQSMSIGFGSQTLRTPDFGRGFGAQDSSHEKSAAANPQAHRVGLRKILGNQPQLGGSLRRLGAVVDVQLAEHDR